MGIFGALTTAVTGMRAQSFALENISGNIANSQTTAFKREDTSFVDLIPDNTPSKQLAGNVIANSRSTNSVQGDIQNASVGTYMAINGQGFFVVEKPASFADNLPVFDGVDLYTRRGDFSTDKNGYLVNGAGYYLMGIPVDADHRQSGRQRAAVAEVRLGLPAGAADDADPIPGQPGELSADAPPTTRASPARNCSIPPTTPSIRRSPAPAPWSATTSPRSSKFDQRRRHHRLRYFGLAGERAVALGQDRQRRSTAAPTPGTCSIRPTRPPPAPAWRGRTPASTTPSPPTARCRRRSRS